MSILIRGEEMPKNCVVCKNYYYCELWSKLTVNKRCKERHPDCPIVEVKEPHGDLVDRGWVRDSINHSCWIEHNDYLEAIGIIDDAPTIIEPEGDE